MLFQKPGFCVRVKIKKDGSGGSMRIALFCFSLVHATIEGGKGKFQMNRDGKELVKACDQSVNTSVGSKGKTPLRHGPEWDELCALGVPLVSGNQTYDCHDLTAQLLINRLEKLFQRHEEHEGPLHDPRCKDAVRGLLLALKTHYPSVFMQLSHPLVHVLCQGKVTGRDIKLRNIALSRIAGYL